MEHNISRKDVEEYCLQFQTYRLLHKDEKQHVVGNLMHIVNWYHDKPYGFGHFLTAVVEDKFSAAVCRADTTNLKCIELYAKFMYNMMPQDYKLKAALL